MKLSIVTTLYKSSLYIDEFYERLTAEAKKITDDYEIIFVDDGSTDDSFKKAVSLQTNDKKMEVVEMIPGYTHDITNTVDSEMVLLLWANETFDRDNPDTYFLEV